MIYTADVKFSLLAVSLLWMILASDISAVKICLIGLQVSVLVVELKLDGT